MRSGDGLSAETKAALEAALQAHVNDIRDGYLVGGYALEAHLVKFEDDGRHHYLFISPDRQAYHSTLGLLQTAMDDFTVPDDGDD